MMKRFFLYGIPKSLLFKIILALVILLFSKNVFAADYNVSSKIKSSVSGSSGSYQGLEIYNSGTNNIYSTGTRYNGQLSRIIFYLNSNDWDWNYNTTYSITLSMATQDWRNHFMSPQIYFAQSNGNLNSGASNLLVSNSFQFISMYKIKFSFRIGSTMSPYLYFNIYSSNTASTSFTGVSNWNLSSVVISDNTSSGGSGGGSGGGSSTPTPAPSGATNQDIINNANSNTQSIIDSSTSNTTDIIDNNNSNTQQIIENQQENTQNIIDNANCPTGPLEMDERYVETEGFGLSIDGTLTTGSYGISPYIAIKEAETYVLSRGVNDSGAFYCWYGARQDQVISCGTYTSTNMQVQSPAGARWLRMTFARRGGKYVSLVLKGPVCTDWQSYFQKKTNDSVKAVNDSINNSNIDSGTGSDFFNDFTSQDNGGISGIITKPLVLINSLLSNNSSCNNLTFGIKFPNMENKNVSFPSGCILWNNVPQTVINIYHMFIVGFCSYYLLKRLFKDVEDLKNPEKDNVEVIDL